MLLVTSFCKMGPSLLQSLPSLSSSSSVSDSCSPFSFLCHHSRHHPSQQPDPHATDIVAVGCRMYKLLSNTWMELLLLFHFMPHGLPRGLMCWHGLPSYKLPAVLFPTLLEVYFQTCIASGFKRDVTVNMFTKIIFVSAWIRKVIEGYLPDRDRKWIKDRRSWWRVIQSDCLWSYSELSSLNFPSVWGWIYWFFLLGLTFSVRGLFIEQANARIYNFLQYRI